MTLEGKNSGYSTGAAAVVVVVVVVRAPGDSDSSFCSRIVLYADLNLDFYV